VVTWNASVRSWCPGYVATACVCLRGVVVQCRREFLVDEDGCGFWIVAPIAWLTHRPDDGDSKHLRNVGKLLPDYRTQQPRRQPSSYSAT
jgi:hypothetical protein